MSERMILGIDPGIDGALALINVHVRDLAEVVDMPYVEVRRNSTRKREVAPALVGNLVKRWKPDVAVIERVSAMPGQGVTSMFSFGRSLGMIEGILAAHHIPVRYITPQEWKRVHGIPAGAPKDESRAAVMRLLPQHADRFARKKDHGRADAILIAAAYYEWAAA